MAEPLKVLLVEDNPDDAELIVRQLARAGFEVTSARVDTAEDLESAIELNDWDLVLADYSLPGFSGLEALRMISARGVDVPMVLVSGVIDVPTALEGMKAGAKDFVLKDDMQRLPSVVERELADAAERRRRRLAESERDVAVADLWEANERLSALARLMDFPLAGMSSQQLLEAMLDRLLGILGADGATVITLVDGWLTTRWSVGVGAGAPGDIAGATSFAMAVAVENRPTFVSEDRVDGEMPIPPTWAGGASATLGVPMHVAGRSIGVLHVDWAMPQDPPEWLPPLLEIAADRCALTLENARFYEREHNIAETLQHALLSISTDVSGVEIESAFTDRPRWRPSWAATSTTCSLWRPVRSPSPSATSRAREWRPRRSRPWSRTPCALMRSAATSPAS